MGFLEIIDKVGDGISWLMLKFSELGQGKLITLIILGIAFYFSLKITAKIVKIILIIAAVSLFLSVGYSWVN